VTPYRGGAIAVVGFAVVGAAFGLRDRLPDGAAGLLLRAGQVVAIVGLGLAGYSWSRRPGAEPLTRGIWSGTEPAPLDPELPALRVTPSGTPGVRTVALSRRPWEVAQGEASRQALIDRLAERAPFRLLWQSDSPEDDQGRWLSVASGQRLASVGKGVDYGAWVLLFFERDGAEPGPPAAYPKTPHAALETLEIYGATAAIWSWFDDVEWLVAVRQPKVG
jgi:hypothetical protein